MDLFKVNTLVFVLFSAGCCRAQHALPDGPLDGVLGKNVTFKTIVDPSEAFLTITWSFNNGVDLVPVVTVAPQNLNIDAGYKGRVWVNTSNGVLTLGPLRSADSGNYAITLVNMKAKTTTGETMLRVLEPVSKVEIKSNMPEAVETNSTVVLNCSAKGSFLKFSWANGTKTLLPDGKRLTLKEGEDFSVLTVSAVQRWDLVGPIYCTAGNKLETEKSAPFNLTVSYGPEDVVMTASFGAPPVRKGNNVTLSCAARSSPPAVIQWYRNGVELTPRRGPQLLMREVSEKQAGTYSCVAHNTKSLKYSSSTSASLSVIEAISGTKVTGPTWPLLAGNHTVNITCREAAGTVATREWLKDNKPLSPGGRVVMAADKSSVMIKTVQKEDNGDYKCQLTNAVNTDSAVFKMVVNYGPEPVAIQGDEAVEVTDAVLLKCSAVSMPAATYTWKFNGTVKDVTTANYSIASVVYKNTGRYTCLAHNAVTGRTAEKTHFLSVKEEGALDEGLSGGAIAGIIIGVIAVLVIAIGGFIYYRKRQTIESPY